MRDKRPVDELSIEELERVLAIKKREARLQRLAELQRRGRVIETAPASAVTLTQPTSESTSVSLAKPEPPAPVIPKGGSALLPQFEDGGAGVMFIDSAEMQRLETERRAASRRLLDRLLLLVEIAAVIGVVMIGAAFLHGLRMLERETAEAQRLAEEQRRAGIPTLEPTPALRIENFILPGGHTLDRATGAAQFNFAEVPAHLAPLVQTQWVQPIINRPPPTRETALNLTIPKLNLSQAIVQGVDWEALKQGVGQLPNGVNPGDETGNVVLAAHNDIYGELFRHLDQLEPGDTFTIQTATNLYTYRVSEPYRIVMPDDVYVLENRQGATATLISCYPYQVNDKRIVIFADRID
jgi:sortase A